MNDIALLRQWGKRRDGAAFREIVSRHAGMVYATCFRVLGDPAEAEDAAQECFILLAEQPTSPKVHVGGWLHAVATRRSLNRCRAKQRRRAREEAFVSHASQTVDPAWTEIAGLVDEAIAALPEELRAAVVAHFMEAKSHAAIARELGVPRRTVSHRIERAMDSIGVSLKAHGVGSSSTALAILFGAHLAEATVPVSLVAGISKSMVAVASAAPVGAGGLGTGTLALAAFVFVSIAIGSYQGVRHYQRADAPKTLAAGVSSAVDAEPANAGRADARELSPTRLDDANQTLGRSVQPTASTDSTALTVTSSPATTASGAIAGEVVLPDGKPYAGAQVALATGDEGRDDVKFVDADDTGRFRFEDLDPGTYSVQVTPPRSLSAGKNFELAEVELAPGATVDDLRLVYGTEGNLTIAGRVVNSAGDPVAGAQLICPKPVVRVTTTDKEGRFRLEHLPEGVYGVYVMGAPHYSDSTFGAEAGDMNVEVTLQGRGGVEGIVVDARTGLPVREFEVAFVNDHRYSYFDGAFANAHRVTDSAGAFVLDNVPAGDVTVVARAVGYAPVLERVVVQADGTLSDIILRLEKGRTLTGYVVDASNQPLANAEIRLRGIESEALRGAPATSTDPAGKFVIADFPPELDAISAYYPGLAPNSAQPSEGVVIVLHPAAGLSVRVSDSGVPAAKTQVQVFYEPPVAAEFVAGGTTDAGGALLMDDLTPSDVLVKAELPSGRTQSTAIRLLSGQTHEVELKFEQASASLAGILDFSAAPGFEGATATLEIDSASAEETMETLIVGSGNFSFPAAPAGDARLLIRANFLEPRLHCRIRAEFTLGANESMRYDLAPSQFGGLDVEVNPVAEGLGGYLCVLHGRRTIAEAEAIRSDDWEQAGGVTYTDGGRYLFPLILPGEYTVLLSQYSDGIANSMTSVASEHVSVIAGETASLRFGG